MLYILVKSDWSNPSNAKTDILNCLKRPERFKLQPIREHVVFFTKDIGSSEEYYALVVNNESATWRETAPQFKRGRAVILTDVDHYYLESSDPS